MHSKASDITYLNKYGKYIIILCWILSIIFYYSSFGLGTVLEASKYIREANSLVNDGTVSAPRFWFYSITILIITFSIKIGLGLYGAFIMQAILNLYALLFFYKALKTIFQFQLTALLAVLYLILFWPYQSWVVYLFTESAFYSLILILLSATILYKPLGLKNILLIFVALFLVIVSRPLGILFMVSTWLYLFFSANKKWKIIIACASVIMMFGMFYVVNVIFSTINDWTITEAFERQNIICDDTTVPATNLTLATSGNPVYKLWFYITNNFQHFIHFAGIKLSYFFLMKRDYYSTAHNYFLILNIIPVYLLAMVGLFKSQKKIPTRILAFILSTIFLYTITIVLQCDDYHNRFVLSIYPLFVLLAGTGAEYLVRLRTNRFFLKNS